MYGEKKFPRWYIKKSVLVYRQFQEKQGFNQNRQTKEFCFHDKERARVSCQIGLIGVGSWSTYESRCDASCGPVAVAD